MSERKGKKRAFISISSDEDEQEESESESEYEDDDCYEEINSSSSCDNDDDDDDVDDDDDEESGSDDEEFVEGEADMEEAICNKVIRLLREGSRLEELSLIECKTYLRKLKLRLSGTKGECINRIKEYWRVKDGNGETLYPRSSFNINCTGDVCKGDVVLFTQKVYQKFDKMKRSGNIVGKRTIAGRITKESYGAARQQHTFTVEVLWSKGIKILPPLFPLLVKGRNLYKMKTFRQRWKNEAERLAVLAEKHKRGAAARELRARKKSMKKSCTKDSKKELRRGGGGNRQKPIHHRLSQTRRSMEADKPRGVSQRHTQVKNVRANDHHKNSLAVGQRNPKQSRQSRECKSYRRYQNFTHPREVRNPTFQSHTTTSSQDIYHTRTEFDPRRDLSYPFERAHTSSTMRLPHSRPYADDHTLIATEHQRRNYDTYPHYT